KDSRKREILHLREITRIQDPLPASANLFSVLVEVALFTDRVEETTRFYETVLGRAADVQVPGMAEFHLGQVVLRVHVRHPEEPGGPPSADHVAFRAEDLEAEAARLRA